MRKMLKSSFLWQFAGGFAIGAVGVFALQPAPAPAFTAHHVAASPTAR